MSTGLCLVTRGMICVPRQAEVIPLISCAEPLMWQVLEARPRMRMVNTPKEDPDLPRIVSTKEQKPVTTEGDIVDFQPIIEDVEES